VPEPGVRAEFSFAFLSLRFHCIDSDNAHFPTRFRRPARAGLDRAATYGKPVTSNDLSRLKDKIKIIHEAIDDTPEFEAARNLLSQAEIICFLGFGFHSTNLRRLFKGVATVRDPTLTPTSRQWSLSPGVKIFGHNYEFTESVRANIQRLLPLPWRWCLELILHGLHLQSSWWRPGLRHGFWEQPLYIKHLLHVGS